MALLRSNHIGSSFDIADQPMRTMLSSNFPVNPQFYKYTDKQRGIVRDLFRQISTNQKCSITLGDLFEVPGDVNKSQVEKVYREFFSLGNQEDREKKISLQECFESAKRFLQDFLLVPIPKSLNKTQISNISDVLGFLYQNLDSKNSKIRSALVFLTRAFWEAQRKELDVLQQDTLWVLGQLQEKEGAAYLGDFIQSSGSPSTSVHFVHNTYSIHIPHMGYRGKTLESLVAKMAREYQTNAETMARDGIGLLIELKSKDDAFNFLRNFSQFLTERLPLSNPKIQNTNFFSSEELNLLREQVENAGVIVESNKLNSATSDGFQNIKFRSEIQIPGKAIPRHIEVQISLYGNNNEAGLSNKAFYKAKQKLNIYSRIIGPFTEDYLDIVVNEACSLHPMGFEKAKENIKTSLVSWSEKGLKWYFDEDHYIRRRQVGIFSENTSKYIENERERWGRSVS